MALIDTDSLRALFQDLDSISDTQEDRILSRLLFWLSGREPQEDATYFQGYWSERFIGGALEHAIGLLINDAYNKRGKRINSYMQTRGQPREAELAMAMSDEDRNRLRERLTPLIQRLLERIEGGEIDPRDVLTTAIALGTASNLSGVGTAEAAQYADDAIDSGYVFPERFDRRLTLEGIQQGAANRAALNLEFERVGPHTLIRGEVPDERHPKGRTSTGDRSNLRLVRRPDDEPPLTFEESPNLSPRPPRDGGRQT